MKKIILLALSLLPLLATAQDSISQNPQPSRLSPAEEALAAEPDSLQSAVIPDGEDLAQRGDSAYMADNFVLAENLYNEALKQGGSSAVLFYNLGNAYYRQGNLGMAIVSYERALRLDPTNGDAQDNLEFVNNRITDKQIDSGSVVQELWHAIVTGFTADTWAWIAIGLFALFIGCVATYFFAEAVALRKFSFFGGMVVFVFVAVGIVCCFAAANRVTSHDEAVILPPASQLSTMPREPRNASENAFLLHEGTKVEVLDSIANPGEGMWYEVRVGGRERAWVKSADVERI